MKRKYIDAERLRAFKEALADTIVCAQGLPTYEDCKKRAEEETDVLLATLFPLQQEQPEAPVDGEVHHVLKCHYLTTDNEQLCARLREFPEGAKVDIFISAKEDGKS